MKQIKLKNGFTFKLEDNVIDNMELIDALAETDDENPLAVSKVCTILYGKKLKKEIYDSFRTSKGNVPINDIADAIKTTFDAFGDNGKN